MINLTFRCWMLPLLLFAAVFFLAYSNGANDNFKGVATLFGSKVLSYKKALFWASLTTFLGSICSVFFAESLVESFSGKGIVPLDVATSTSFVLAIAVGAGGTVMLASVFGFPISTTHSLIGALLGAGYMEVGDDVNVSIVANKFLGPLLLSPFLAIILGVILYKLLRYLRKRAGLSKKKVRSKTIVNKKGVGKKKKLKEYKGTIVGIRSQRLLNVGHVFSAGAVCFARALNDTPKFVALFIAAQTINIKLSMLVVGVGILFGGLLHSKKVAETMSNDITKLNHGQGLSANLVTAFLVIIASKIGVPVSTTHVSVGSLIGIGIVNKKMNLKIVKDILLSWLRTLPFAAVVSSVAYLLFRDI